jgi:putative sterol carrier protein/thioredoxin reductase
MEKSSRLGGTVAALSHDPLTSEFENFVDYLRIQMEKLKIDVKLNAEVDAAVLDDLKPDAIIMATGATLIIPDKAQGQAGVIDHIEALNRRQEIGRQVVVWGLMYGAELALSLAEEGKDVVLLGEAAENTLNAHASDTRKYWVLRKLTDINVLREGSAAARVSNPKVLFNTKVKEITAEGLEIENQQGQKSVLPYDTLIISRGRRKNDALYEQLEGKAAEIYKIGDCAAAGNIQKAIWSANEVARKVGQKAVAQTDDSQSATPDAAMSPDEFKQLFSAKTDEEILALTKGNEETLLDGMFDGMQAAFDPSAAAGQSAVMQYVIDNPAGEMNYQLNVADGNCELVKGPAENPRVTLAFNLPDFLRMMTGELDGIQAFTSGKLKITGDLMFSQVLSTWFKDPNA